ncbi:MAG: FHA domain-containing protein [Planctomycetaceae bacterium]|nr:FHA domain-containing protein [Planctomycetaceae bacterium]
MAQISFQVLDGLERGVVFADLETPITIGREDDNDVRLNDERVSRFHAKVQDDDGHIILTDLQSTNGTRVNGHPVQVHVLQVGDQIQIGRCLLVYGTREELARKVTEDETHNQRRVKEGGTVVYEGDESLAEPLYADLPGDLFPHGVPCPPAGLTPLQTAQVSDLLAYVHSNLTNVLLVAESYIHDDHDRVDLRLPREAWHRLQQVQMHLAETLRKINDPSA